MRSPPHRADRSLVTSGTKARPDTRSPLARIPHAPPAGTTAPASLVRVESGAGGLGRAVPSLHESDLVGDDYSTTQTIAAAARDAGFHAILAPAAALPDRETLAVFAHALPSVQAERSEIRQPPPRLADLLPLIRPHERVPDAIRRLYRTLARSGADAIRRRRRSDP